LPGKSLRCAIEEFAAFLIQFVGGCEEQTQYRRWLSLRESHARFQIGPAERTSWLKHMGARLEEVRLDEGTRKALGQFFLYSSAYIVGKETADPQHGELAARWSEQRVLDEAIGAIAVGHDHEAVALAAQFAARPSIFVGIVLLPQLGTDPNIQDDGGHTPLYCTANECGASRCLAYGGKAGLRREQPTGKDRAIFGFR
jgi:hypothetical protein